jgi:response regulator RpfG family c-di-GMP phosphodiesterase
MIVSRDVASTPPASTGWPPAEVADLVSIASDRNASTVNGVLRAVREHLGLELAILGELTDEAHVYRALEGDAASFGLELEGSTPLDLMPDVRAHPVAGTMEVTEAADVGAYVSVPVRFSDGRLWGTLCAGDHAAAPWLSEREVSFLHVLARLIADQLEREEIERQVRRLHVEAAGADALLAALAARDDYTEGHSRAVVDLARRVAQRLELEPDAVADVELVALLPDIGKIGVPDAVLRKPGQLDDDEWKVMRRHPATGAEMVAGISGLQRLAPAIRAEHEYWDGGGYPDGLAGDVIPQASRIVLVCDAYHAMISDRPYRQALGRDAAVRELQDHAGSQFDPDVVAALLAELA